MIEWCIIIGIIFCSAVWYYSQSVSEYSLSQIKESQISVQLSDLLTEKKPIIISDVYTMPIWTSESLKNTRFWSAQPVWESYQREPENLLIETNRPQQMTWSDMLGISEMESNRLLTWFDLSPYIFSVRSEAHIGAEGLRPSYAWSTMYKATEGELRVILLHKKQTMKLPPGWLGLRWKDATIEHHPLWVQVQCIEIILRPGTVLLVPPHWTIAIEPLVKDEPIWWIRSDVHHPISRWAQQWNERLP